MVQGNFLDIVDDEEQFLDIEKLTPDAFTLYQGYCKVTGLNTLPESDRAVLEKVAREYHVEPLLGAIRGWAKSKKSGFGKSLAEKTVRDFHAVKPFLAMIGKTAIKKEVYNQRFRDVASFIAAFADNEKFIMIQQFFYDNGYSIDDSDVSDLASIINDYSEYEIDEGIKRSFKDGRPVCNIKFLMKVMKAVKSEGAIDQAKLEAEERERNAFLVEMEAEKVFDQQEIADRSSPNPYEEEDKRLIQEIIDLRNQGRDDKENR